MKKIISILFLIYFVFSVWIIHADNSTTMTNSKKVEERLKQYNKLVNNYSKKVITITSKFIEENREEELKEKYEKILDKLDEVKVSIDKSRSIYAWILKITIDKISKVTKDQITALDKSISKSKNSAGETTSLPPLTEEEKEQIIDISSKNDTSYNSNTYHETWRRLESTGEYTRVESAAVAMRTSFNDWFKFCANFPGDLYGEKHKYMVEYYNAQSPTANEYKNKIKMKTKNYFSNTSDGEKIRKGFWRLRKCSQYLYRLDQQYGFTQSDIQALYERLYPWEKYRQYTKTIFENYTWSDGMINFPVSLEAYIQYHHEGKFE